MPQEYSWQWDFYYSAKGDHLYCNTSLGITKHLRLRHNFDKEEADVIDPLPANAVPVQVRDTSHTWILPRHSVSPQDMIPPSNNPHSILDLIDTLPQWEQHLLSGIQFLHPKETIWTHLCTHKCTLASNGSIQAGKGAFAWIISDHQENRLVHCSDPAFWTCHIIIPC